MIAAWEAEIAELEAENLRLEKLKSDLQGTVIPGYDSPINDTATAAKNIKDGFTIDGESIDKKSIENRKSDLSEIKSTLNDKVIPAIDAKIAANNARIAELRALIAAELARIAAEQEAAWYGGRWS